jgi:uncharacterized protein (DUF302 family)
MHATAPIDPPYGYTAHLPGVPFDQARSRIVDALKNEGFGVLTEIDVKSTLKAKLERDFRRYVILGACNPQLAHRALEADSESGSCCPATSACGKRRAVASFPLLALKRCSSW